MKKTLYLVLFILIGSNCSLKSQNWQWAKNYGFNADNVSGSGICKDNSGNIFLTGTVYGQSVSIGSQTFSSNGDAYLTKLDANGNVLWALSSKNGSAFMTSVCCDSQGNAYICGSYYSASIAIGSFTLNNFSTGYTDVFIAKVSSAGNVVWAKSAGGESNDWPFGICTDLNGNIYLTGSYRSSFITFGSITLLGYECAFITKYNSTGNVIWAKSSAPQNMNDPVASSHGVATDGSGNFCIAGNYTYSMSIGGSTVTSPSQAVFVAKYSPTGVLAWLKSSAGPSPPSIADVSMDNVGNVYITGHFYGASLAFGTQTITGAGYFDVFVVKYDAVGNVVWAKCSSNTDYCQAQAISTFSNGIYVVGNYTNTISFGSHTLTSTVGSANCLFVVEYDFNGNVLCATSIPTQGSSEIDIFSENNGNAYVAADYGSSPLALGSNTLAQPQVYSNAFVGKFDCGPVGLEEFTNGSELKIFPNPSNGIFNIQNNFNSPVSVYNILGELIFTDPKTENENWQLDLSKYASGIYFIKINSTTKKIIMK